MLTVSSHSQIIFIYDHTTMDKLTGNWSNTLNFAINGRKCVLKNVDASKTVLQYLRENGLTGTTY